MTPSSLCSLSYTLRVPYLLLEVKTQSFEHYSSKALFLVYILLTLLNCSFARKAGAYHSLNVDPSINFDVTVKDCKQCQ